MGDNKTFEDLPEGMCQGVADGYVITPEEQKKNFLLIVDLLALLVDEPDICRHLVRHKRKRISIKNLHRIQKDAKLFLKRRKII